MKTPKLRTILGQPSWTIRSDRVVAHLTRQGGHLGPVSFRLGRKTVEPLSVAPWHGEKHAPGTPALLRVLRGDFFCAPFGDNARTWHGEKHPPHGEAANSVWSIAAEAARRSSGVGAKALAPSATVLRARLRAKVRPVLVEKEIMLVDGQTAVYQRHVLSGSGPLNAGHHAMLKFPEREGSGIITTSRFVRGQVFPGQFCDPAKGSRQCLKPGAMFRSLRRVPRRGGGTADLSRYPARRGYEDLVMLTADPSLALAWTAVTFPAERYAWFSLRDPRVLTQTLFWISNGGRDFAPWNGRHTGVLGLEDVTSYFHYGLAESAEANPVSRAGIPTAFRLDPKKPTEIRYLFGVAAIPAGFDRVAKILERPGGVELVSASGKKVRCALDLGFLRPR